MEGGENVAVAGGALKTLIHQFADPFSFYREVVQNALDAGSRHVHIDLSYDPDTRRAQICIEDGGSGMTEHVIDTQLTRLFASKKDGDLTRIGKFGIGFVSIFALAPERVTLETWSEGEGWLVEFLEDGQFERRPLGNPREGTLVRIFKSMDPLEFQLFRRQSRDTVVYWCKHVDGEILFDGELLNQEFGVDTPVSYRWSVPDTDIVIGYPEDGQSFVGFYNQGLTLMESTTEHVWPGLSVKANSRFLEHTLTRDNIVEDENFQKVSSRVQAMLEKELVTHLFSRISKLEEPEALFGALLSHFGWHRVRRWRPCDLGHHTGEAHEECRRVSPGRDTPGLMVVDAPGLGGLAEPPDEIVLSFSVPPDIYTPAEQRVCRCFVYDLEEKSELCFLELRWGDFRPGYGVHNFALSFTPRPGQKLDFRVEWGGEIPLMFHALELRRRVTRELSFTSQQSAIPLFQTAGSRLATVAEVLEAQGAGRLWFVSASCTLATRLQENENLVILASPHTREWEFLTLLLGAEPRRAELELVAPVVHDNQPEMMAPFEQAVAELARQWGGDVQELSWAAPDCRQSWFALLLPGLSEVSRYELARSIRPGPMTMVLNSEHPLANQVRALAERDPYAAAYLVSKQFLSQSELTAEMDSRLALSAWRLRGE